LSQLKRPKSKSRNITIEKTEILGRPAGLAKTRKIIRAEKEREFQFLKLCSQIRLNDYKQKRAEEQMNERRAKRKND
jgi:hypothetical protein